MSARVSESVIDLLVASGVPSREEALELVSGLNGGSWTSLVLDSGKVDEHRFLNVIGDHFRVPVVNLDPKAINRELCAIVPSRFVFQHHILQMEVKENETARQDRQSLPVDCL